MSLGDVKSWRCRHCKAALGEVRAGRLYVSGRLVFHWVGPCPACCKRAEWHSAPAWLAYITGFWPELPIPEDRSRRCCGTRRL